MPARSEAWATRLRRGKTTATVPSVPHSSPRDRRPRCPLAENRGEWGRLFRGGVKSRNANVWASPPGTSGAEARIVCVQAARLKPCPSQTYSSNRETAPLKPKDGLNGPPAPRSKVLGRPPKGPTSRKEREKCGTRLSQIFLSLFQVSKRNTS
jgi:hypothetical protein